MSSVPCLQRHRMRPQRKSTPLLQLLKDIRDEVYPLPPDEALAINKEAIRQTRASIPSVLSCNLLDLVLHTSNFCHNMFTVVLLLILTLILVLSLIVLLPPPL
jgi:hypothetical protein